MGEGEDGSGTKKLTILNILCFNYVILIQPIILLLPVYLYAYMNRNNNKHKLYDVSQTEATFETSWNIESEN